MYFQLFILSFFQLIESRMTAWEPVSLCPTVHFADLTLWSIWTSPLESKVWTSLQKLGPENFHQLKRRLDTMDFGRTRKIGCIWFTITSSSTFTRRQTNWRYSRISSQIFPKTRWNSTKISKFYQPIKIEKHTLMLQNRWPILYRLYKI